MGLEVYTAEYKGRIFTPWIVAGSDLFFYWRLYIQDRALTIWESIVTAHFPGTPAKTVNGFKMTVVRIAQ